MMFSDFLDGIKKEHPEISFIDSDNFCWKGSTKTISYIMPRKKDEELRAAAQILHELGHALLNHTDYSSDVELLKLESSAWEQASRLAHKLQIELPKDEIEQSLQSYINWASSRSLCPKCKKNGLQIMQTEFYCLSCDRLWRVSRSRFTRTYRKQT